MLRALSLTQPWAWVMTVPPAPYRKEVENRTWKPPPSVIGTRFAIHASRTWDRDGERFIRAAGFFPPSQDRIERGAVVALAVLSHVVTGTATLPQAQHRWFFGPYGLVLRNVTVLETPVTCKGSLGFFALDATTERAVLDQVVAKELLR